MRRSFMRLAALLLAAMLTLPAARGAAAQESSLPPELIDVEWRLVALQRGPDSIEDTTDSGITLIFRADGAAGGSGGCNVYGSEYSAGPNQALTISNIVSTLRACEGRVGELEQEYFTALQRVASYSQEPPGTLQLILNDGVGRLSFVAGAQSPPAEDGERRCFSETGKCVSGRFLEYWEANGGLPVFGLPISDELSVDGRPVQYFERQRFELHPENAPPYDVLLGRLGDELLRRQGIDWSTLPKASDPAGPGCRSFPETGHTVCDQPDGPSFLSYWSSHGLEFDGQPGVSYAESLALFGLPLSEPMEQEIEGRTVLVQWFERARFEWHPENPEPYRVLLGRLGAEWLATAQ